ncbi:MAG: hypothetical protein OCD76_20320 [Reichenbachiella sp.]
MNFAKRPIINSVMTAGKNTVDMIWGNINRLPRSHRHLEFTISHFLRKPIANMYSIVFELGLNMNNEHLLMTDLNILKHLNKELSKAIKKIESEIDNGDTSLLSDDGYHYNLT